jgi:site-specific recombinase XerD
MPVRTTDLTKKYLEYIEKIENLSVRTVENRRHILTPFFRVQTKEISDLTLQDIDNYFIDRSAQVKPSTIGAERQAFRSFFKYCQEYLEMDMQFRWEVIHRKKDKPGRVRTFSKEEVSEVIAGCKHLQDKLIIALMFESGIRIGELLTIQVQDITDVQIRVRGKGAEDRVVFMSEKLAKTIAGYTHAKGYTSGFLFRPVQQHYNTANDRYTSAYAVRDRIKAAFKQCGYSMHPHQLRHSFAVNWIMEGGDIRTLQILLGHASLETTQWYLRLSDRQTQNIYQRVLTTSVFV